MNMGLEHYKLMMTGAEVKSVELSKSEKETLSDAYKKLFLSLTASNWAQKNNTLGQAWYKSIQQLERFLQSDKSQNSANAYLKQIFAAHKAKWQQVMMTNKNKEQVLELPPEDLQNFKKQAAECIIKNINKIEAIREKYKELEKSPKEKQQNLMLANEQIKKMLIMQAMQKQRERSL